MTHNNDSTHYVSDQIAEPRPAELPESRYEAALQLWREWFAGGGRDVPPIPDDTSLMLQWIVGRFRAATRETRGTPGAKSLASESVALIKAMFGLKDIPLSDELCELLLHILEEDFAKALASQPVAPPPPNAHRTLQRVFNELNDPEQGESERWVKIEEILHEYFRAAPAGTQPAQEGKIITK